MERRVVRWAAAALVVTATLGFAPSGCGSSGGRLGVAGQGDAELPDGVAREIRTCAANHMHHLSSSEHTVSFDVKLASNGEVDSIALLESTLGDEELETCMAKALRSLSGDDLPLRHSSSHPQGPLAPEARALLGQTQALSCLSSPPCLLALAFFIGAAYVAVQIYVHAAQSSTAKPRTAPIATTMPTAIEATDEDDPEKRCRPLYDECLENRAQPAWNQKDFGPTKDCLSCYQECKFHARPRGTWPDYKCPRN